MKLKYQMRGLGIGIIVTSILMGVATSRGIPLTDAEIMARASELGMVESNSLKLSDVGTISTPVPESGESRPETDEPEDLESGESQSETGGSEDLESGESQSETGGSEDLESGESQSETGGSEDLSNVIRDGDMVTVMIESGMDSYAISVMLAEAGLVEDAVKFDNYLCDNAYSRKIVNGTYEILIGTGEEEIAKIITRDR